LFCVQFVPFFGSWSGKDVFNCDFIVSFNVVKGRTVLFGVFEVKGKKNVQDKDYSFYYDLEQMKEFEDFEDRVVIEWGKAYQSWHQGYDNEKVIVQILPKGYIGSFPGLLNTVLDFGELERLMQYSEANIEWKNHLSSVNGIYLILDTKTGNQYIGSAYGKEGIWQRWNNYSITRHGGNKELMALCKKESYFRNFRFSILQTLPSNITNDEIIKIENLYKEKLGSRVHGLNQN
jgi:limonene-1,2-epoxide hydrolase